MAWTSAGSWGGQIVAWAVTIIVVRLLTPADYGLVGMAGVYIGLLRLVNELGLGAAIVQRRDLTPRDIASLAGISISFGVLCCLLSIVLAVPISRFFREPRLVAILWVFSLVFVTAGLRVAPASILARDLRFRLLAAINLAEVLIAAVTSLILASTGFGYWALVLGNVVGSVTGTAIILATRPQSISRPTLTSRVRSAVMFGLQLVTTRVAGYAYSNADFAIIGRVLGATPLGWYTVGWEIAGRPVEKISSVASQVAYPVLAALREDRSALRRHVLNLSEGLALVAFPIGVGLSVSADDLVRVLLGERWLPSVTPLRILAIAASIRMLNSVMHQVLPAAGHAKTVMRITLCGLVGLPPLFYVGTRWGITGVAVAWLIGHPLVMAVPSTIAGLKIADTTLVDYLRVLWRPAVGSVLMGTLVLFVRSWLGAGLETLPRLLLIVGVGVVSYGCWASALYGKRLWNVIRPSAWTEA